MSQESSSPEGGPWAREKLSKLAKYLKAYATIMAKQTETGKFKGFVFVDAFAGAGRARVRERVAGGNEAMELFAGPNASDPEVTQLLDGSPRVALTIDPPFTAYVFLEKNPERRANSRS